MGCWGDATSIKTLDRVYWAFGGCCEGQWRGRIWMAMKPASLVALARYDGQSAQDGFGTMTWLEV